MTVPQNHPKFLEAAFTADFDGTFHLQKPTEWMHKVSVPLFVSLLQIKTLQLQMLFSLILVDWLNELKSHQLTVQGNKQKATCCQIHLHGCSTLPSVRVSLPVSDQRGKMGWELFLICRYSRGPGPESWETLTGMDTANTLGRRGRKNK